MLMCCNIHTRECIVWNIWRMQNSDSYSLFHFLTDMNRITKSTFSTWISGNVIHFSHEIFSMRFFRLPFFSKNFPFFGLGKKAVRNDFHFHITASKNKNAYKRNITNKNQVKRKHAKRNHECCHLYRLMSNAAKPKSLLFSHGNTVDNVVRFSAVPQCCSFLWNHIKYRSRDLFGFTCTKDRVRWDQWWQRNVGANEYMPEALWKFQFGLFKFTHLPTTRFNQSENTWSYLFERL